MTTTTVAVEPVLIQAIEDNMEMVRSKVIAVGVALLFAYTVILKLI